MSGLCEFFANFSRENSTENETQSPIKRLTAMVEIATTKADLAVLVHGVSNMVMNRDMGVDNAMM